MYRKGRAAFGLTFISLLFGLTAQAQSQLAKWEKFDFARQTVVPSEMEKLSLESLKLLRGIIFGRHGRVFKEQEIQDYLYERDWYKPDAEYRNSRLNEIERKNLDIIREAEARKHKQVEPGDLRFYQDRPFTPERLGKHSLAELRIMRAEIEAIHGKRFDDEPALQTYFEERYWYKPAAKYDPDQLTEIERKNLAVIAAAEKQQRNLRLAPGDMIAFQNRLLTEDLLVGLSLYELRLLRNEIYALRGRQFKTFWIQQYFYSQPWYDPLPDFSEPKLSPTETKNVATIAGYENRIHEELSTKLISRSLLEGLFLEDASKLRNEIYARRGKIFKNRWLQQYFASFAWYKPAPDFNEKMLTDIEKKNVATILVYEKEATSVLSLVEG